MLLCRDGDGKPLMLSSRDGDTIVSRSRTDCGEGAVALIDHGEDADDAAVVLRC
jgi:hypothetical protein